MSSTAAHQVVQSELKRDQFVSYNGAFQNGLFTGVGDELFPDSSMKYRGSFSNSAYCGLGRLYNNSTYYQNFNLSPILYFGTFRDGRFHGTGSYYYNTYRYKGSFIEGEASPVMSILVRKKLRHRIHHPKRQFFSLKSVLRNRTRREEEYVDDGSAWLLEEGDENYFVRYRGSVIKMLEDPRMFDRQLLSQLDSAAISAIGDSSSRGFVPSSSSVTSVETQNADHYFEEDGTEHWVGKDGREYWTGNDGIQYWMGDDGLTHFFGMDDMEYWIGLDGFDHYIGSDGVEYWIDESGLKHFKGEDGVEYWYDGDGFIHFIHCDGSECIVSDQGVERIGGYSATPVTSQDDSLQSPMVTIHEEDEEGDQDLPVLRAFPSTIIEDEEELTITDSQDLSDMVSEVVYREASDSRDGVSDEVDSRDGVLDEVDSRDGVSDEVDSHDGILDEVDSHNSMDEVDSHRVLKDEVISHDDGLSVEVDPHDGLSDEVDSHNESNDEVDSHNESNDEVDSHQESNDEVDSLDESKRIMDPHNEPPNQPTPHNEPHSHHDAVNHSSEEVDSHPLNTTSDTVNSMEFTPLPNDLDLIPPSLTQDPVHSSIEATHPPTQASAPAHPDTSISLNSISLNGTLHTAHPFRSDDNEDSTNSRIMQEYAKEETPEGNQTNERSISPEPTDVDSSTLPKSKSSRFDFFYVPHGQGEEYYASGKLRYKGSFSYGVYDGQGSLLYNNGNTYTGSFQNGQIHGDGQFCDHRKSLLYKGHFDQGEKNGYFEVYNMNGYPVYFGMFEHNMMHGKGLLFDSYCDGILYEGQMNRGQLISNGVRVYYFGHLFYEGDVTQNFSMKEMSTCYTTTNAFEFLWKPSPELDANTVTLSVRNDYKDLLSSMMYVPNVQGKLYYINRQAISRQLLGISDQKEANEVVPKSKYSQSFISIVTDISSTIPPKYYDGEFSDGMLNGIGTMYWYNEANDGKFTGQFLNDICHGNGVYLTPDGSSYSGSYFEGTLQGAVTITNQNGVMVYKGDVDNEGRFHGNGVFYLQDGSSLKGEWEHGVLTHGKELVYWKPIHSSVKVKWNRGLLWRTCPTDLNSIPFCYQGSGYMYYYNGDYVYASFASDGEPTHPEYTVWSYGNRILYKGGMNRLMRAHGMGTLYVSANEDNADWIHRTYRELPYQELPEPPSSFWVKNDGVVLYSGSFNDGYLDGKGEIHFDNGFLIKGEWARGVLRSGSIYGNNHLLYTGEFDRNKRNGKGEQYENGQLLYCGSFVDDAWTGRGEKLDSFGVVEYRGGFRSGVYHGFGTLFKDGKKWIHGYWREGKPAGIMREYMDGVLVYEGEMKDLERDGVGCVFYGKMCYEGEFICGKINLNRVNVYEMQSNGEMVWQSSGRCHYVMKGNTLWLTMIEERGKRGFYDRFVFIRRAEVLPEEGEVDEEDDGVFPAKEKESLEMGFVSQDIPKRVLPTIEESGSESEDKESEQSFSSSTEAESDTPEYELLNGYSQPLPPEEEDSTYGEGMEEIDYVHGDQMDSQLVVTDLQSDEYGGGDDESDGVVESDEVDERNVNEVEENDEVDERNVNGIDENDEVDEKSVNRVDESDEVDEKSVNEVDDSDEVDEKSVNGIDDSDEVDEKSVNGIEESDEVDEKNNDVDDSGSHVDERMGAVSNSDVDEKGMSNSNDPVGGNTPNTDNDTHDNDPGSEVDEMESM